MPVHVINEANRCLQCKNPRCRMQGCPIQTNIPEVIRLFKENKMMEAAGILFENNPLSVVAAVAAAKQIADNMDSYMQAKFGNKTAGE